MFRFSDRGSPAVVSVDDHGLTLRGDWNDVGFALSLTLEQEAPAWRWHGTLENKGTAAVVLDLVYAQDLALAHYGAVRMNEYYVSQYVDYTPLEHPRAGHVLAVRQNLPMGGRNPWALIGSLRQAVSFATDALRAPRPCDPRRRRRRRPARADVAGEASSARALDGSDPGCALAARARGVGHFGFFGWFEEHHPTASSAADLAFIDRALALPQVEERATLRVESEGGNATLFSARPILKSLDLTDAEVSGLFGRDLSNVEREDGRVLSFFAGSHRHVVLKAKELKTLRPHGHIIRSGDHLVPDESSLTSTTWMGGVFNSLVTQGHVSINRFLSTTRGYLGLQRCAGQRIFVELADGHHLLDVPSAYEITPNGCRWLYKHEGGLIEVRSWAPIDRHELDLSVEFVAGDPRRLLVSHHVALNGDDGADAVPAHFVREGDGVVIRPVGDGDVARRFPEGSFRIDAGRGTTIERVGGDEELFLDGRSRRQPFVTVVIARNRSVSLRITGHLIPSAAVAPEETPADWASDQSKTDRFWNGNGRPPCIARASRRRLRGIAPSARHPSVVRPQRHDPLLGAARIGAVLGWGLGHARRVPGAGRAAASARQVGPAA